MKKRGFIKNLTFFSSMVTLLFVLNSSSLNKKNRFHLTTKVYEDKIEYNSGTIYIGDEEYLNTINDLGKYDVLALDNRSLKDPDIRIYDSYKITNPSIREEIIEGLLLYEEVYPSNWDRSKESAMYEWTVHNLMYQFGYKVHRTMDVDLNNADEKTYQLGNKR